MEGAGRVATVVGAIAAVALQVLVAPNISLGFAVPNFLLAYTVVIAVVRAEGSGPVMPFLLGLIFDLVGGGPVGAMAFVFGLVSFLASKAFSLLDNGTLFMPVALVVVSLLAGEVLYGALLLLGGSASGLLEAFAYRSLPCALYDSVLGLVMYPLYMRFAAQGGTAQSGMPLVR